jgi:hypothetical protein
MGYQSNTLSNVDIEFEWLEMTISVHWIGSWTMVAAILSVMEVATKAGQVTVLEWVLKRDQVINKCRKTCAYAAYGGHLDALQWLRRNGCPWDGNAIHLAQKLVDRSKFQHWPLDRSDVSEWATKNGCLEVNDSRIYSS